MGALTQDQTFRHRENPARTHVPVPPPGFPCTPRGSLSYCRCLAQRALPPYSSQTAGIGGIKGHQQTMTRVAFPCPAHCCLEQSLPGIQLPGDGVWSSWTVLGGQMNITHLPRSCPSTSMETLDAKGWKPHSHTYALARSAGKRHGAILGFSHPSLHPLTLPAR